MRIPSGVTDQYIYFVALDATDLKTRETGLASFTVYRSRNGGAAAAFTTPTINEVDATNMPGLYELLLDEDMTIDAGDDSQEMAFHITHAGMAPVTRVIELYRPKATAGETITVSSGVASSNVTQVSGDSTAADTLELFAEALDQITGQIDSGTFAAGAIDAAAIADDAIDEGALSTNAVQEIRNAITGGAYALDTDANGRTRHVVGTAAGELDTSSGLVGLTTAAINAIADQTWDEVLSGHLTAGSTGNALNAAGSAGDPWSTALPGAYGAGTAGKIIGDNINATISSRATQTSVDTIDDFLDTEIAAILADTNELQTDWANGGRLDLILDSIQADTDAIEIDTQDIQSRIGSPAVSLTADIAALNDISAADVWAAATRTLTALDEDATTIDLDAVIRAAVGMASANLDTQIAALPTAAENATELFDQSNGVESGITFRQAQRALAAALCGIVSGAGSGSEVFKGIGQASGGTTRITYTVDASGNRSAVALSL